MSHTYLIIYAHAQLHSPSGSSVNLDQEIEDFKKHSRQLTQVAIYAAESAPDSKSQLLYNAVVHPAYQCTLPPTVPTVGTYSARYVPHTILRPHLSAPQLSSSLTFHSALIGANLQYSYCTLYYCSLVHPVPLLYLHFCLEWMCADE